MITDKNRPKLRPIVRRQIQLLLPNNGIRKSPRLVPITPPTMPLIQTRELLRSNIPMHLDHSALHKRNVLLTPSEQRQTARWSARRTRPE